MRAEVIDRKTVSCLVIIRIVSSRRLDLKSSLAEVAQLVERPPEERQVAGSSPALGTTFVYTQFGYGGRSTYLPA